MMLLFLCLDPGLEALVAELHKSIHQHSGLWWLRGISSRRAWDCIHAQQSENQYSHQDMATWAARVHIDGGNQLVTWSVDPWVDADFDGIRAFLLRQVSQGAFRLDGSLPPL